MTDQQEKGLWGVEALCAAAGYETKEKREELSNIIQEFCRKELPPSQRHAPALDKARVFNCKSNQAAKAFLKDSEPAKALFKKLKPQLDKAQAANELYKQEVVFTKLIQLWNNRLIPNRVWETGRSFTDGERPSSISRIHEIVDLSDDIETRVLKLPFSRDYERSPSVLTDVSFPYHTKRPRLLLEECSFNLDTSACEDVHQSINGFFIDFSQTVGADKTPPYSVNDFDIDMFKKALSDDPDMKNVQLDRVVLRQEKLQTDFRLMAPDLKALLRAFLTSLLWSRLVHQWIDVKLIYRPLVLPPTIAATDEEGKLSNGSPTKRKIPPTTDSPLSESSQRTKRLRTAENSPKSYRSPDSNAINVNSSDITCMTETVVAKSNNATLMTPEPLVIDSDSDDDSNLDPNSDSDFDMDMTVQQPAGLRQRLKGIENVAVQTSISLNSSNLLEIINIDEIGPGDEEETPPTNLSDSASTLEETDVEIDPVIVPGQGRPPNTGRSKQKRFHIDKLFGTGAIREWAEIDAMSHEEWVKFAQFHTGIDGDSPNVRSARWNEEDVGTVCQLMNIKNPRQLAKHKKTKVRLPNFICKPGQEPYLWQMVDAVMFIHCFWKVGGGFLGHDPGFGKTWIYWGIIVWCITYTSNDLDYQEWASAEEGEYKGLGHLSEAERLAGLECPTQAMERDIDVGFQTVPCPCELDPNIRPDAVYGPHRLLGPSNSLGPQLVDLLEKALSISDEHKPHKARSTTIYRPNMRLILLHNSVNHRPELRLTEKDKKLVDGDWEYDEKHANAVRPAIPLMGYLFLSTLESYKGCFGAAQLKEMTFATSAIDEAHNEKNDKTRVTKLDDGAYKLIEGWRGEGAVDPTVSGEGVQPCQLMPGLTIYMTASVTAGIFVENYRHLIRVLEKRASEGPRPWSKDAELSKLTAERIEELLPAARALRDELKNPDGVRRHRALANRDYQVQRIACVEEMLILRSDKLSSRFGQLLAPQSLPPVVVEIPIDEHSQIEGSGILDRLIQKCQRDLLAKAANARVGDKMKIVDQVEVFTRVLRDFSKQKIASVERYITRARNLIQRWQQRIFEYYESHATEPIAGGPYKGRLWKELTRHERGQTLEMRFTVEQVQSWNWHKPEHYNDELNIFNMLFEDFVAACLFIEPVLAQMKALEAAGGRTVYLITCAEISVCIVVDMWLRRCVIPVGGVHHFKTRKPFEIISFNSLSAGKNRDDHLRKFQNNTGDSSKGPNVLISTNARVAASFNFGNASEHFKLGEATSLVEDGQLSGRAVRETAQGRLICFNVDHPRDRAFRAFRTGFAELNKEIGNSLRQVVSLTDEDEEN